MRLHPLLCAALVLCPVALTSSSAAQETIYRSSHPLASRAQSRACVLIEAWDSVEVLCRRVTQADPEDALSWYYLGRALGEQGKADAAVEAHLRAAGFEQVQAWALYDVARVLARAGDPEGALGALQESIDAGLPAPAGYLRKDRAFRDVASTAEFKGLVRDLEPVEKRVWAAADADDHEALVGLCRGISLRMLDRDDYTVLDLLRTVLLEHARAREADRERLGARALRLGRAADEALGNDAASSFVERGLRWSAKDAEASERGWKRVAKLAGSMRSHRFGAVIEGDREIRASARAIGDPKITMFTLAQGGLAHISTLNFDQPRRGVSPEQEWESAHAAFTELLELATRFGELDLRDDALSGLAQLHLEREESTLQDVETFVFEALMQRPRLPYGSDGLGFYEDLARRKREASRGD